MSNDEVASETLAQMVESCVEEVDGDFKGCMVRQVAAHREDPCPPRAYLIVSQACGGCDEAKKDLADFIRDGLVEVIDEEDPRAYTTLQQGDIETLPALVIVDCEDNQLAELDIFPQEEENGRELQDQAESKDAPLRGTG